ncbi:hypothetical protein ACWHAM_20420 [Paenibacillus terrae]
MAQQVGLGYCFDKTIPANTFDAYRLTHFAAVHGKAFELSERILTAYFTDGLKYKTIKPLPYWQEKCVWMKQNH